MSKIALVPSSRHLAFWAQVSTFGTLSNHSTLCVKAGGNSPIEVQHRHLSRRSHSPQRWDNSWLHQPMLRSSGGCCAGASSAKTVLSSAASVGGPVHVAQQRHAETGTRTSACHASPHFSLAERRKLPQHLGKPARLRAIRRTPHCPSGPDDPERLSHSRFRSRRHRRHVARQRAQLRRRQDLATGGGDRSNKYVPPPSMAANG